MHAGASTRAHPAAAPLQATVSRLGTALCVCYRAMGVGRRGSFGSVVVPASCLLPGQLWPTRCVVYVSAEANCCVCLQLN